MAWKYTFDGGPEKDLDCKSTLYAVAAMAAFASEDVFKMPTITTPGVFPYEGHTLELWDDKLLPHYGPYSYGIGFNQCGSLTIPTLTRAVITSSTEK